MEKRIAVLRLNELFYSIDATDIPGMLQCLAVEFAEYQKEETVFLAGQPATRIGIVCSGEVQVMRDDIFGNRNIMTKLGASEMFGEAFACARVDTLPVSVVATQPSTIALLDYRRIITMCANTCPFHSKLIENMLSILAQKNVGLRQRIEVLSARSTRSKLMLFLSMQAERSQSTEFDIPFNRQELADFLSVDRSAMSSELGRMQEDGQIRFHKNHFALLDV